ncbi:hypothetical protein [Streptomyces sp. MJM8645]|uniref:hypothetical protein n=1 Tax=Streptomyces sp. MJM8645 TaxID=1120523 RepID=UPI0007AFD2D3|nr:hypothetical protein [Streptomyces sp. MJM8645]
MSPKKNRSYGARRAREKQAAGAVQRYTDLLPNSTAPTPAAWEPAPGRYAGPEWTTYGNPFIPPAGAVGPADDPYGRRHEAVTVPFLLTAVVLAEPEGWRNGPREAAQAVQAACRHLVRDGRWYRATADVYGPLPAHITMPLSHDEPAPPGHVTLTWLVALGVRRPWDDPELMITDAHRSIRAQLTRRALIPQTGCWVQWVPTRPGMAQGLMERLPVHARVRNDVHPSLLPDPNGSFTTYDGGFPQRLIDAHGQGWHHLGDGRYAVDPDAVEGGFEDQEYDVLAGARGPLDPVVEPDVGSVEQIVDALERAGRRAVASLLVALHRLDTEHQDEARNLGGATPTTLYAAPQDLRQTREMRSLIRGLGPDLADDPTRWDPASVEELYEGLSCWTELAGSYTPVAHHLAQVVTCAASTAGGWQHLADDELCAETSTVPGLARRVQAWLAPTEPATTAFPDVVVPVTRGGEDKTTTTIDLRAGLALHDSRSHLIDFDFPTDLPAPSSWQEQEEPPATPPRTDT